MTRHIPVAITLALALESTAWADQDQAHERESAERAGAEPSDAATGAYTSEAMNVQSVSSGRSRAHDWMLAPAGSGAMSGQLTFLTADAGPGDQALAFTDAVLTTLSASRSFGRVELHGAQTLVPKQPSFTDAMVWQGGALGALVGLTHRSALGVDLSGGPLLDDRGWWGAAALGARGRRALHETLLLEGGLAGSATGLREDPGDSWLAELVVGGEMMFRVPNGAAAAWVGTEFRFPVADGSEMTGAAVHDPQTRVNFQIGGVVSYIDDWDVWVTYAVLDRGDAIAPATTLPILAGGFDQQLLIIGMTQRFGGSPAAPDVMLAY